MSEAEGIPDIVAQCGGPMMALVGEEPLELEAGISGGTLDHPAAPHMQDRDIELVLTEDEAEHRRSTSAR
jgi:hypothetical protein